MFIKTKTIKGNDYFYLMQSQRLEGKSHPISKTLAYLGSRERAIATLESSDYPAKDKLLARVRATAPATGPNKGRRGRPKKAAALGRSHRPSGNDG
jgi:hypothetical protein